VGELASSDAWRPESQRPKGSRLPVGGPPSVSAPNRSSRAERAVDEPPPASL
jgi:hypothetical protein